MTRPDFAWADTSRLTDDDVLFLIESFPEPARSYEGIARILEELPNTLESALTSRSVVEKVIHDRDKLLRISPFLLFNVLLRQVLDHREGRVERRVINYLANLLAIFVASHRLYRVEEVDAEDREYLVDLLEEAMDADDRRRFMVHAHVGNYALYLSGVFEKWIESRHRYGRRPVDTGYYADLGSASFGQAATLPPAKEYELTDVFVRLSLMFDPYRTALSRLANDYLM